MAVGKRVIRVDARAKADGSAKYVADMSMPGMLVGRVLHSPVARGRITNLDIDSARKIAGVRAVVTAEDIPGGNICHIVIDDMPLLANGEVKYTGEPIALVAAESRSAVEDALEAMNLQIEQLPPLTDPEKYADPDSPRLSGKDNIFAHHKIRRGKTDVAFGKADIVIERTYRTTYQEHAYLETQGMLAVPTQEGGIDIYGSMQCPFYVHGAVATVCGLPQSKVRIIQTTTGGAFGGKEDVPSLVAGWAAVLALKANRPVKLILDRSEDIISMSKRHPSRTHIKLGADKKGKLVAAEVDILFDAGAYATLSSVVLWRGTVHACGPYRIPAVKIDARAVATNKVPCGAYRGFGSPQTLFAIESAIDELAYKLDIDPVEFRRINILKKGDKTVTGQKIRSSCGLEECLERAVQASDFINLRKKLHSEDSPVKRGLGISTIFYGMGLGAGGTKLARTGAYVSIQPDGSVQFAVGTTEMGQGMRTVLGQIVAEAFGIPFEKVSCLPVDTSRVPDSGPTVASRATTMSGRALLQACTHLKRNLAKVAAAEWGTKDRIVNIAAGKAIRTDNPDITIPWNELAAIAFDKKAELTVVAHDSSPPTSWNPETGQGDAYVVYSWCANIAQVAVDTRTGEVRLEKLWAAHDIGKAINPTLVEGQIEGGSVQGMGYGLTEEYIIDENGIPLNPKLSFYYIPTTEDAPTIEPIIVESAYDKGPFGAKGFGEQPLMGIAPAIANAIFDAVKIRFREQPFTPEKVWPELKGLDNED
ncbi:xanthine dehydrogenase [bacterium]|nr:MAG: xanthine dehydrogenase [bacterium]